MADRSDFVKFNLEAAVSFASQAIKSAFLLNGGAAIALLAFIGGLKREADPAILVDLGIMKSAFEIFTWGLGASLGALIAAYLAQLLFVEDIKKRAWAAYVANAFRVLALVSTLFALGTFIVGTSRAISSISGVP